MKLHLILLVALASGCANSVAGQESEPTSQSLAPDKIVTFKKLDAVELKLHFFLPTDEGETNPRPAIVFFFGGGWISGSPSQFYRQSRYLASRGMVACCAEYRVRSRHQTTPVECVKDGKSAIRWLRAHAGEWGIDPNRIAAAGGSAGGHVAAATATIEGFDEEGEDTDVSCRPNALVLFNPVYDNGPNGYGHDRVQEYWEQISPLHHLSKSTPPTIVFLGTEDELIPVATARRFHDRLEQLAVTSELHLYEGGQHGFFNRGEEFSDTLEKADRFLTKLGYLSGEPGDTSIEAIEAMGSESKEK